MGSMSFNSSQSPAVRRSAFDVRRSGFAVRRAVVLALGALIAVAACDGVRRAPAGATMTLFTSSTFLPVNGEADITALLIKGELSTPPANPNQPTPAPPPSGIVVNDGTVVQFSTTLGRIEPAEAKTTDGQARVKLIGDGRSGTAIVTALSGTVSQTIEIQVGAAGAERISLTANPVALPAGGGVTTVSARVEDAEGNGLPGVPVHFSSNNGILSETSVLTNSVGVATTSLDTVVNTTVTGTIGGTTGRTATVNVTVAPGEG
jgi:hypothetical protein